MGRTVTIPLPAATTKTYLVDRDTTLMAGFSSVTGANASVVSSDPALTAASLLAAPAAGAGPTGDVLLFIVPNSASFAQNLKIPLPKGSTLYLNSTSGCWMFLLFEETVFQAEIPVT
jgi:hypothetical protein